MAIKRFNELTPGNTYLLDKSNFTKDKNENLVYIGEYLPLDTVKNIQNQTNSELKKVLDSFTIKAEFLKKGLYVSPLQVVELFRELGQQKIKENTNNEIAIVCTDYYKAAIFEYLINTSEIFRKPTIHLEYYKKIEEVLDEDLHKAITSYKIKNGKTNFLTEEGGLYNPIIVTQLEKLEEAINQIIDTFSREEMEAITRDTERAGRSSIYSHASDYLYNKYNHDELVIIAYNSANDSLKESLLYFDKLLGGNAEDVKNCQEKVQKLLHLLAQTLKNIKIKPKNEQEMNTIMGKINEDLFNPFIDFLEENIKQDDHQVVKDINHHMNNIYDSVANIIALKNYEYDNVDSLSALGLYIKLEEFIQKSDIQNILFVLSALSTCSSEELEALAYEYKLHVLDLIIKHENDNKFSRGSDTIGSLCDDKHMIEEFMKEAIKLEKYNLASILRDLKDNL